MKACSCLNGEVTGSLRPSRELVQQALTAGCGVAQLTQ